MRDDEVGTLCSAARASLQYHKEEVLANLQHILDNGPMNPMSGLCYNLAHTVYYAYHLVDYSAYTWPHTRWSVMEGGEVPKAYFVPHDPAFGKWEGPNLTMRQDLIRHVMRIVEEL